MRELELAKDNVQNDRKVFGQLKTEPYPLYLWGAGNMANEVYRVLCENEIQLSGVFVDVAVADKHDFKGYRLESLDELVERKEKINVIMGHAQYHKMVEMQSCSIVNCVFYILNPFRTHDDINEQYFYDNQEELMKAYNLFEEEYSRRVFQSYLNTRINSNIQYLLDVFEKPMDFFDNGIFVLNDKESYIDIGAYTGDTIKSFYKAVNGMYDTIYAFEPDEKFFGELRKTVETEGMKSVYSYQLGVWDRDTTLCFESDDAQSGRVTDIVDDSSKINVVALDNFLENKAISLIKIACSAGNLKMIRGGGTIIRNLRPKIAVTIGIKRTDLFEIPILLKKINPAYHLYLRYLESMPSRLTIFAV